jgi:hypothetical protein
MLSSIDYLTSAQNEAGGWGYSAGQKSVVEPTAAVLLAIRDEEKAIDSFNKGISWLLSSQNQDGGWGIHENDPQSGWHTAWALIALKKSKPGIDSFIRGIEWLSFVSTNLITEAEFKDQNLSFSDNVWARVWPWLPGQGSWIEPTALAVLALEGSVLSSVASIRMNAAIEYFRKNRTPVGGWDFGNAGPYETIVLPHAYRTSLVLLALSKVNPDEIIPEDLSALSSEIKQDLSILSVSSGLLGLKTMGKDDVDAYAQIADNQLPNGSWNNNTFFTAWAMMALRGYF